MRWMRGMQVLLKQVQGLEIEDFEILEEPEGMLGKIWIRGWQKQEGKPRFEMQVVMHVSERLHELNLLIKKALMWVFDTTKR